MSIISTQTLTAPWTKPELQSLVGAYFQILNENLLDPAKIDLSPMDRFLERYPNRSKKTLDFGFCQISSVLACHNMPYLLGFDPVARFSNLLEHFVITEIENHPELDNRFLNFCIWSPNQATKVIPGELLATCPDPSNPAIDSESAFQFSKPNYLEIEQKITVLKNAGEDIVIAFEKWRLHLEGKGKLADQVVAVRNTGTQDMGYDVLSKNVDGTNRYISVKTTKLGKYTPFVYSNQERNRSIKHGENYHTYRVFDLAAEPRMFIAEGNLDGHANVKPVMFQANF